MATDGALPLVSVIVPVRNGQDVIGDCIRSILANDYPAERREILVVDNGSLDRTSEIVEGQPVRHLSEPRRGVSWARNRGILESQGEILAFTDADCVATTRWLSEIVEAFEGSVSGVAGEIFSFPPRKPVERYMAKRKGRWQLPAVRSRTWPFAATGNVAFRREVFAKIGLFDPLLVRGQDKDIGRRFLDAGLELRYAPRALVFHRLRSTTWGFFTQHEGWGYGAGLLHTKYGLPWGFRDELRKYGELLEAGGALVRAAGRHAIQRGDPIEVYYPLYELVRRVAHRAGTLRWLLWRAWTRGRAFEPGAGPPVAPLADEDR